MCQKCIRLVDVVGFGFYENSICGASRDLLTKNAILSLFSHSFRCFVEEIAGNASGNRAGSRIDVRV